MQYVLRQTVWFVEDNNVRSQYELHVTKVARKWVSLSFEPNSRHPRWRVEQGEVDVDGGRGTVYASKEAYEAKLRLDLAWWALEDDIKASWRRRKASLEDIKQARVLLGLDP